MVKKDFHLCLTNCILAACLFMAACQPVTPRTSGLPLVMATESFLGDIAQNVAGSRIKVETLLPVTVDPHEYQPKPQDVTKLAQAQVLIVNGLGYEIWLQKTLDSLGGQRQVIVATNGLIPDPDPSGQHPEGDPHMWMNPLNTVHYVEQIRDGLSQADPAGKDIYARNADAYIAKLQSLDQWVKDQVNQLPVERRLLVTNHDALGYFAKAYDFKIVGAVIPSVTTDASPSAQQLASLINTIKSSGVLAIFLDIGENQNLAQQIASETGVKVVTDLYVESISGPNGPAPTYIDMIKHDVTVILDALK
jgi:ABC-type Zn uptake system ZnuABC Zn-binding protein ZnuA